MQEKIFVNIGQKLRLIRKLNRLTLQDVGGFLKITSAQVQKYETGESRISITTLFKIAHFFKIHTTYFLDDFDVSEYYDKMTLELFREFSNIENPQIKRDILLLIREIKK